MPSGVYPHKSRPLAERFWAKVDRRGPDECWPWLGCRDLNGYGQIRADATDGSNIVGAHVVSYEIANGPLPAGHVPDHTCRNPSCVNPAHLEAVTMGENTRRGTLYQVRAAKAAERTHCNSGHPWTAENVRDGNHGQYCRRCQAVKAAAWREANRARVNLQQQARRAARRAVGLTPAGVGLALQR